MTSSTSAGTASSDSGSSDAAFFLLGLGTDSRTFAIADREELALAAGAVGEADVVVAAFEVCRERVARTAAARVVDRAMAIPIVCIGAAVKYGVATTALKREKAFVGFGIEARATSRRRDVGLAETNSLVSMLEDFDFATAAMASASPLPLCD